MNEVCCEAPDCSLPGTICPACEQNFCWQSRFYLSFLEPQVILHVWCDQRLVRLLSIGLCILLCGILFLLLPHENYGTVIQLAILLLVVGSLLIWIGFLART
jgi:hypothetical protein